MTGGLSDGCGCVGSCHVDVAVVCVAGVLRLTVVSALCDSNPRLSLMTVFSGVEGCHLVAAISYCGHVATVLGLLGTHMAQVGL